jgi:hypothetical protein
MSSISLTPAQHAILAHAIDHAEGRIEWFPPHLNGGARQKVLDGLAKRELIRQVGKRWRVAASGYDATGVPRPDTSKKRIGKFEAKLDQIIANAEGSPPMPSDAELEAAVTAVEATCAKPRTRANSKQDEVVRMLQRPEGATVRRFATPPAGRPHRARRVRRGVQEEAGPDVGVRQAARRRPATACVPAG